MFIDIKKILVGSACILGILSCAAGRTEKSPADYVNPYMGNISHLLVPTYPTVHLPNSILRVYPERADFTSDKVKGLPVIVTSHRGSSAFNLSFNCNGDSLRNVYNYTYDREVIKPYYYSVTLDEENIDVEFAPSHQSAVYRIDFLDSSSSPYLILNTGNGELTVDGNTISGWQSIDGKTKVYVYMETSVEPQSTVSITDRNKIGTAKTVSGRNAAVGMKFTKDLKSLGIRYGVSFIDQAQAKANLHREITNYDVKRQAEIAKAVWNEKLGKIKVTGVDENVKTIFYTSLYRTYERMISLSEDGRYYSAFDGKIHNDGGHSFYTDDWIWDTYRAVHPLRVIIEPEIEGDMINSFVIMAEQMGNYWMPTFPEVTGDSRRMNSNHAVATVADALAKGVGGFDVEAAYRACKAGITEKTLAPWSGIAKGKVTDIYWEKGYFPALANGEKETSPEVNGFEKRQPVAVTLGTSYDEWCLSRIAKALGKEDDYKRFSADSYNYRNIFNRETKFFHPKDAAGNFIEPFDYVTSGGLGAREAYGENNGWVYRWDVQHNIADLIDLMGGEDNFADNLEQMYNAPLGRGKSSFYSQLPDHTGNVGQFSMANEPSLHIPYLYNYISRPWMTQKRVRTLLNEWFRNDLMGVPGDEDGGGMSAFVVFSMLGFYPVTPGLPMYAIGSPYFEQATVDIGNGKTFKVVCKNYAPENKYIQSAQLNGQKLDRSWFKHDELMQGGVLELVMGDRPNRNWAAGSVPPSFDMER